MQYTEHVALYYPKYKLVLHQITKAWDAQPHIARAASIIGDEIHVMLQYTYVYIKVKNWNKML